MPEVSTTGGTIAFREAGEGVPVVMLHANLHDHRDFDPVFAPIAQRHRAIALDWPRHGDSGRDGPSPSGRLFAGVLAEVVTALALGPSVFIGNSVGGYAAARLAIEQPDAVAGLVLVNSGGFTRHTPISRAFCRLLGRPAIARQVLPKMVSSYMKAQSHNDHQIAERARGRARTREGAQVGAHLWRSFVEPEYDLRGRAQEISVPTLIVWGADDIVLSIEEGRSVHAAISGSTLHEFPTGHVPFSSRPNEFLAVLMPFLEAVTTPAQVPRHTVASEPIDG
jgi:pimeloyl-ACP methyl ester carboxylesterase